MPRPTDPRSRVWRLRAAGIAGILVAVLVVSPWPLAAAATPAEGTWFEYDYNTYLDQGAGDYEGYTETLRSHSRYTILAVQGDLVTVHGTGSWTFEDSYGTRQSDVIDVTFSFSISTRRYVGGTDLDGTYVDPRVWFWVPTPLAIGVIVPILDDFFTVTSLDASVWVGAAPRKAALLEASGTYVRDDVYGRFDVTYTDRYYFDAYTGFVVSESYEERDTSFAASFRYRAELFVTSSSYPVPFDWLPLLALYGGIPGLVVAAVYAGWRLRYGPRHVTAQTDSGPVRAKVRRIRRVRALDGLSPEASRYFSPFLQSFARRALTSGDPVAIATAGNRMVGLLTYDGESALGSLFAMDGSVAKALLRRLRIRDFFTEFQGSSWDLPAQPVDSFKILERKNPEPMPYDPQVVRPMTLEDLAGVKWIAQDVYRGRASRWIQTCYEDGDLAFVGMADGLVVGFGFATVADSVARLHTLTVRPSYRARGIGSEIMAARLSALAALGVDQVLVEISRNNAASLRVASKAGFEVVGETIYYSRQPRSSAFAYQRQF